MKDIDRRNLFAIAMAALLLDTAACDSLDNPEHFVIASEFTSDGTPLLFFPDGVASVDAELKVSHWTKYPRQVQSWQHAASRDGTRAAIGRGYPASDVTPRFLPIVEVFAIADGRTLATVRLDLEPQAIALSEHGDLLLVSGGQTSGSNIRAISLPDGQVRWSVPGDAEFLVSLPDANAVAVLSSPVPGEPQVCKARILDLATGAVRREIDVPPTAQSFGASSDGSILVVGHPKQRGMDAWDGHFLVFGVDDGGLRRELVVPDRVPMGPLVVSSGGRFVGAVAQSVSMSPRAFNAELLLFDGDAITFRQQLHSAAETPLALSPDDAKLIVVGQSRPASPAVTVYQVPSGTPIVSRSYRQDVF